MACKKYGRLWLWALATVLWRRYCTYRCCVSGCQNLSAVCPEVAGCPNTVTNPLALGLVTQ